MTLFTLDITIVVVERIDKLDTASRKKKYLGANKSYVYFFSNLILISILNLTA